jgi:ABC-type glutathione transport system ATPase component
MLGPFRDGPCEVINAQGRKGYWDEAWRWIHLTVALETQGLRKSFGGVLVIDDLSISVSEGEALGIVGPNGAGKTTWFNLSGAVHADREGDSGAGASTPADERCRRHSRFRSLPFTGMTCSNIL